MAALSYELPADGASLASLPGYVLFTLRSSDGVAELWSVPAEGGAPQSVLPPEVTIPEGAQAIRRVLDRIFFTACDASHGCELWSSAGTAETTRLVHDIRPGSVSSNPDQLLAVGSELVFTADDGQHGVEPWHVVLGGEESCVEGERALCLDGDRFLVRARWRAPVAAAGDAASIPLTTDTGAYWFFGPDNIELILKAIDGGGFNGHEWIFYGALSNVEYSIDVTDTATGHARRYFNPAGRFASVGDIHAFPLSETSPVGNSARPVAPDLAPVQETAPTGSCVPTETRFCILEGRFAVEAVWRDFQGRTGTAQAGALTDDTGYFWFFDDANIEIVVKAIDGSTYNGQFWIYYGALSNVEYTIRVTDTSTLAEREYRNPLGRFGSFGDIVAFPAP
jgi:ELWxxDGT repeat protein